MSDQLLPAACGQGNQALPLILKDHLVGRGRVGRWLPPNLALLSISAKATRPACSRKKPQMLSVPNPVIPSFKYFLNPLNFLSPLSRVRSQPVPSSSWVTAPSVASPPAFCSRHSSCTIFSKANLIVSLPYQTFSWHGFSVPRGENPKTLPIPRIWPGPSSLTSPALLPSLSGLHLGSSHLLKCTKFSHLRDYQGTLFLLALSTINSSLGLNEAASGSPSLTYGLNESPLQFASHIH